MELVTTIRPKVSLYASIGAVIVNLLAIVPVIFTGSWVYLPSLICSLAVIDLAVWLFFVNPKIAFDEGQVVVTNPLRIFRADWGAIKGFETKFGLAFVTEGKKFVSWSAPAPSRREVRRLTRDDLKGSGLENFEFVEPGLIHSSESGSAYWQFEELRANNTAQTKKVRLSANWLGLACLIAILILAYVDLHI